MKLKFFILLSLFFSEIRAENISVIGVGKVGLTLALSLEKAGYNVLGVDVSSKYVDILNDKNLNTKEPGIKDLLVSSKNFHATTSLDDGLNFSDTIFVFLSTTYGTPSYNFSSLTLLLKEIASKNIKNKHIIINSTVLPGYIENTVRPLFGKHENITISYNPPFIAQGDILFGLTHPDMVLIGAGSELAGSFLKTVYKKLCYNQPYFALVSVESAEIAKMALNCFVTSKISFANLIGDVADMTPGADKFEILNAIGKDTRIGSKYFKPGYGFGGPCFTRDNIAFMEYVESIGMNPLFFHTTDQVNQEHAKFMANQMLEKNLDYYEFEDLSYKENCQVKIIESSQKLKVAQIIAEAGKTVILRDVVEVLDEIKSIYGSLFIYCNK